MVQNYEVDMAKHILSEKEKQTQAFLKLHSKLVAFLIKRPDLVYQVEIRSHPKPEGGYDTALEFTVREVTEGWNSITFYEFDRPEMIANKFNAARDFTAGAITSFPNFWSL